MDTSTKGNAADKKVLIIEDEQSQEEVMEMKFTHEGFIVLKAKNGEEGLHMALSKKPDLILLDLVLPKMDGITVMEKLKEDEWGKKVPVIVLTNVQPQDTIIERVAKDEPAYFLLKPEISLDDVVAKAKDVLNVA